MARDPKYDVLFEPVKIGPTTMKNRFYKPPHCTSYGSDWPGTQAHFRAVAGEGGWAACNTEYCSVHPSSDDHGHVGARLWDDNDVRNLGLMCEKLHEHDSLAGVELWYGSAHAINNESRLPARGVSQIPSDYAWMQSCFEMDKDDIQLSTDDAIAVIELADPMVHLWDVQLGGVILEWGEDTLASRFGPQDFQRPAGWQDRGAAVPPSSAAAPEPDPGGGRPAMRVDRGAVTERVVNEAAAARCRLVLGPSAVLTPSGRDRARQLGVEIEKEKRR